MSYDEVLLGKYLTVVFHKNKTEHFKDVDIPNPIKQIMFNYTFINIYLK